MNWLTGPGPLFNPLVDRPALSPAEILAGPFGLVAFLPLVPLVALLGRRWPRAALALSGLIWLVPTVGLAAALVLLSWLLVAGGWVVVLGWWLRRGWISSRLMTALVWVGLHVLILPLWWQAQQPWYPSRMAALHNVGFSYFLLRLIAWGVDLSRRPQQPLRIADSVCWLLYAPAMRLGPVLRREEFLERLAAWPRQRGNLWAGARRFGWFLLGVLGLTLAGGTLERLRGEGDFFAAPQYYSTGALLAMLYLVPVQIYLLLWSYNELAVALSLWVGIRVDDNFHRLPLATSVREFWHRWHITVGRWLRDYVYIPLGGNRRHAALNITLVFAYIGWWHGASWSFLAWGLSQAAALNVQRLWDGLRRKLRWRGPDGPLWTTVCWLATMHFQVATILVFADFEYVGLRFFRELIGRMS